MPTTGSIPLTTQIPGNLISAVLWNNEFGNVGNLMDPFGTGGYSATDTQMQIQTAPFPGSVTSHAASLGGELERIRYQLAQILGTTYWYNAPAVSIPTLNDIAVPLGGYVDLSYLNSSLPIPNPSFLLANGQAISRTTYAALFVIIGTVFGTGDGSTTFNLPNCLDRMSIGAGNLYTNGQTGGATTHTLTKAEIPTGLHTLTDPGHTHSIPTSNTGALITANTGSTNCNVVTVSTTGSSTTGTTLNDLAGGGSHSILNPFFGAFRHIRVL